MKVFVIVFLGIIACASSLPFADIECPPVDDEHGQAVVVPHPSDCSFYVICTQGVPVVRPCSEGLVFNPETSTCDWPHNVPECSGNSD
ncbi:peritrophin-1-like [Lutzomyia longipalpis]|uniref:Peritrophin (Per32) n=2 Tax=Lutzomyia longipalpis TaxID=7200 RepID=A8CWA9_LUTLO|nr:peritrophin-1-like [Lutzomyia longipalpis]ABV60325.1 putative peritrophin [Lutzomyia longipalpis]